MLRSSAIRIALTCILLCGNPAFAQDTQSSFVDRVGQRIHVYVEGDDGTFFERLISNDNEGFIDNIALPQSGTEAHLSFLFITGKGEFLKL